MALNSSYQDLLYEGGRVTTNRANGVRCGV